ATAAATSADGARSRPKPRSKASTRPAGERRAVVSELRATPTPTSDLTGGGSVAELREITRIYRMGTNEVRALDRFSFSFKKGEYWSIMGSSGSGKSTLLNILGCLDRATSGSYKVRGEEIEALDDDAL